MAGVAGKTSGGGERERATNTNVVGHQLQNVGCGSGSGKSVDIWLEGVELGVDRLPYGSEPY